MCVCVCVCVCVCLHVATPEAILWTLYDKLNKFCNYYIVAADIIVSRCELRIDRNKPYKTKLELYNELLRIIYTVVHQYQHGVL